MPSAVPARAEAGESEGQMAADMAASVPASGGIAAGASDGGPGGSSSAPGYPVYPQGMYPQAYPAAPQSGSTYAYQPNAAQSQTPGSGSGPYTPYPVGGFSPAPQQGGNGNNFPSGYPGAAPQYQPYPYPYYYVSPLPPKPKGETYVKVVSWIVIVTGALGVIGGLLSLGLLALIATQEPDNIALYGIFGFFGGAATIGGIIALVSGINRLLAHTSRRFVLPPSGLFAALAVLILITGIVLWNVYGAPGAGFAVFPLTTLAAIVPSLAILAFTSQRLGGPSTRRHVWLSLFYGATLAPIVAIILELLATLLIYLLVLALGQNVGNVLTNITVTPQNPIEVIAAILNISVTAAVVEEGVKPLAAVLIMRRLRSPAEAFLVGMAGGIGFNMFEATGYITGEQADWITQAIGRSTAGLLHGVGAGMAALGWYYLINGRGVPLRWVRGFGFILYAMVQHAINNAAAVLLGLVPPTIGQLLSLQIVPGVVPFATGDVLFMLYDVLIFLVLLYVTAKLRRGEGLFPGSVAPPTMTPSPEQDRAALAVTGGIR